MASVTTETSTDGIPLSESERRIWAEIAWAERNDELRARYAGEWAALENRVVIAHGPDRDEVLRAAAVATQRPQHDLAVWLVVDGTALLRDQPLSTAEV